MKISVFILLSISIVFYACKPAAKVPDNKMKVIMWSIMKDSYDSASNTFKFNAGKHIRSIFSRTGCNGKYVAQLQIVG